MQTLTLNARFPEHEISFHLAKYADNGNFYVGMICYDEGFPEPWSDLTVNLEEILDDNCAYIDVNNNGNEIIQWLIANNLGHLNGGLGFSGFCMYPEFEFNMHELIPYVIFDERRTEE